MEYEFLEVLSKPLLLDSIVSLKLDVLDMPCCCFETALAVNELDDNTIMRTSSCLACIIVPAWLPYPGIGIPYNILYGVALGAILSLHTKALSVFHWSKFGDHDDMPARVAVVQAVAGVFVAMGIVWTRWVVDHTGERGRLVWKGVELGFGVSGTVAAYVMLGVL